MPTRPSAKTADSLRDTAWELIRLKRPEEAVRLFEQALADRPDDVYILCGLSYALQLAGDAEQALAIAERAIAADPEEEWGFRERAGSLLALGRPEEALRAAAESLNLEPDNYDCVRCVFSAQIDCKRYEEAERSALRLREMFPDEPYGHAALGLVCCDTGRYADAEQHNRKALAIQPDYSMALCNLGVACYKQGRLVDALDFYYQALRANPLDSVALGNLKSLVGTSGFADLQEFLKSRGDSALWETVSRRTSLVQEARALMDQGRYDDAIPLLDRALKLAPTSFGICDMLCEAYTEKGQPQQALSYALFLIDRQPENWLGHWRRARALGDSADRIGGTMSASVRAQAIDAADEAVRLSEGHETALNTLFLCLVEARRWLEAERAGRRLVEVAPNWWVSHFNNGWMWEQRNRHESAEPHYRRAAEVAPENAKPISALGLCLLAQNRRQEALLYLHRAVRLDPGDLFYRENLARALRPESGFESLKRVFGRIGSKR